MSLDPRDQLKRFFGAFGGLIQPSLNVNAEQTMSLIEIQQLIQPILSTPVLGYVALDHLC